MKPFWGRQHAAIAVMGLCLVYSEAAHAQEIHERGRTSYMPVDQTEPFADVMARMKAEKPEVEQRQPAAARPALRPGQPPGHGRHHVARQAGAGRRAGEAAAGRDLGLRSPR